MKKAYILAAGAGEKIQPYGELRNKSMIPLANKPVIGHLVEALIKSGITDITVGAAKGAAGIRNYFRNTGSVSVVETGATKGTAVTLNRLLDKNSGNGTEGFFVFYGDVLIHDEDVNRFIVEARKQAGKQPEDLRALVTSIPEEEVRDFVCCSLDDGRLMNIVGHPREDATHRFSGFFLPPGFEKYIANCDEIFHNVEVGMMSPVEQYLELSVLDFLKDGGSVYSTDTLQPCIDIDKPWHILMANELLCCQLTDSLTENDLADGASIDEKALVSGTVRLGKNSRIGPNVRIDGNIVVGDNTIIDNGAIFAGSAVIGDNCLITNYCFIDDKTTIGNKCVVNHCAEISGTLLDNVYLYHYMEIYGLVGESTDIGAATVCGSLRFDDGATIHKIRGRRELPREFSNASYIGDFCRTGVNAIIMPGCKMGPYSLLGSAVVLEEDLPAGTSVRVKQEFIRGSWGPERYGW